LKKPELLSEVDRLIPSFEKENQPPNRKNEFKK
jgi:hypothetical protein